MRTEEGRKKVAKANAMFSMIPKVNKNTSNRAQTPRTTRNSPVFNLQSNPKKSSLKAAENMLKKAAKSAAVKAAAVKAAAVKAATPKSVTPKSATDQQGNDMFEPISGAKGATRGGRRTRRRRRRKTRRKRRRKTRRKRRRKTKRRKRKK